MLCILKHVLLKYGIYSLKYSVFLFPLPLFLPAAKIFQIHSTGYRCPNRWILTHGSMGPYSASLAQAYEESLSDTSSIAHPHNAANHKQFHKHFELQ
jgi:hypothetical protein